MKERIFIIAANVKNRVILNNIENEHISSQIAKELKSLGLHSFSLDYWVKPTKDNPGYDPKKDDFELMVYNQGLGSDEEGNEWEVKDECERESEFWEVYHAYNFSEIRAIVPYEYSPTRKQSVGRSTVDTWGSLLVTLLKSKIITVDDIKKHYA